MTPTSLGATPSSTRRLTAAAATIASLRDNRDRPSRSSPPDLTSIHVSGGMGIARAVVVAPSAPTPFSSAPPPPTVTSAARSSAEHPSTSLFP